MTDKLRPIWVTFPGSFIRHKVFVGPDEADPNRLILQSAESLFQRFTLDETKFPISIQLFESASGGEPLGEIVVGLEYKDNGEEITAVFTELRKNTK